MKITKNNLTFYIEEDYAAMSAKAAEIIAARINEYPCSVIGFATGGTPVGTYERLIRMYDDNQLDFSRVTAFNLDEYHPIQKNNDQSYDFFMRKNLFDHINQPADKRFIPNGETQEDDASVAEECERYEAAIAANGGIDLQICGMGHNGHIGFNEPDSAFSNTTHRVELDSSTINANARFFSNANEVPDHALTMGTKTIMMARQILMLVSGAGKSIIAQKSFFGLITPHVPSSALQMHQNVTVVMDRECAAGIKELL